MVIDESAENLIQFKHFFANTHYQLFAYQNPTEALKYLDKINPHLIVIDTNLSTSNAFVFARKIRENIHTSSVPIIFTLNLTDEETLIKAYEFESADILSKPCKKLQTLFRVKSNIEKYFYLLELNKNLFDLKEKQEDTETLARILTHDISNSLTIISHNAEIIKHEKIKSAVKHATDIVRHVKEMLSFSAGKMSPTLSSVFLTDAINDVIKSFEIKLQEKELNVIGNWRQHAEVQILSEENSLKHQVLSNLLSNAIKFSYPKSKIDFSIQANDNVIKLKVSDQGQGIPSELLPDLFNKYTKTTRLGTAKEKGTGFGLPILKRYLEFFGAQISVASKHENEGHPEDHGTEFTVIFKKAA